MPEDLTVSQQITIQPTPNPNAMKFSVGKQLTSGKSQTYSSAADAAQDPMAAAVFAVAGVKMVFVLNDFVTITKEAVADWNSIAPAVKQVLAEQLG